MSKIKAYRNLSQIVTLENAYKKDGRRLLPADLSIIENASIVFKESINSTDDEILWVGKDNDFPKEYNTSKVESFFYENKVLTPEIVDAHTHLIFGGDRSSEYSMRLNGATYEEIAASGGGILFTVNETRKLSSGELFDLARKRVETIHSYGIGTIEIKSGYGLEYQKELELSEVISDLKNFFAPKIQIINTFMAAHAVPPEFKQCAKTTTDTEETTATAETSKETRVSPSTEYLKKVVIPLLNTLAPKKIIDSVDIFFENNYFTREDTILLANTARQLNLPFKVHVDEFSNHGGGTLAAELGAISCEHLLQSDHESAQRLANSQTVAVLLPGTGLFLGKPAANARQLLDAGVRVAIASDYNPGSCHCDNLMLLAALAAPMYKMNIGELWSSITLNAAHAVGLKRQGALLPGLRPRFTLFNVKNINHITYHWGKNFSELYF